MMDEASLKKKLAAIEALYEGATTEGEREAAAVARLRIRARLEKLALESPPIDFKFTLLDVWSRRLLIALLRRYELSPFRYRGQRTTTVMVKVSKRFVDETLWPQFLDLERTLRGYLDEVTSRVISEVVHGNTSEVSEVDRPRELPAGTRDED